MAAERLGASVTTVQADVTNNDDLDRLYATAAERNGRVGAIVANAGRLSFGTIETYTGDELDESFALNMRGLTFTVQKGLALMPSGGAVVLASSIGGSAAPPASGRTAP